MIEWFPGHMKKGANQIKEMAAVADLFIVVLDARVPLASYNEDFDQIAPHIPRLFVIAKNDLADHHKMAKTRQHFTTENTRVLFLSLKNRESRHKILKNAKALLAPRYQSKLKKGLINPQLRAIVVGVPNVGKSTLINLIATKNKAKVANMPGVTRSSVWFKVRGMQLLDTPGILWPKIENNEIIIKLVITNIIKSSHAPLDFLFYESYKLFSQNYPNKLKKIGLAPAFDKISMHSQLAKLCKIKNFVKKNNFLDTNKAIMFFIEYLKKMKDVTYD